MNLLELLIKGAAIGGLTVLFAGMWRRGSASQRHAIWLGGVLAMLALPILLLVVPRWNISVAPRTPVADDLAIYMSPIAPIREDAPAPRLATGKTGIGSSISGMGATPPSPSDILMTAWLTLGLALIVKQIVALAAAARLLRRSQPLLMRDGVPVMTCPILRVPATLGVWRPVVLMPTEAAEWGPPLFEAALAHELSHVRRRDWLWSNLASVMVALNAVNPISWFLGNRMRAESEQACDDAAIKAGADPSVYASELVALARKVRLSLFEPAALSMARPGGLERRIRALIDPARRRTPISAGALVALCNLGLVFGLPLALVEVSLAEGRPDIADAVVIASTGRLPLHTAPTVVHPAPVILPALKAAPPQKPSKVKVNPTPTAPPIDPHTGRPLSFAVDLHVVDPDGRPVEGATLWVGTGFSPPGSALLFKAKHDITTGADGNRRVTEQDFEIEPHRSATGLWIAVHKKGFAFAWIQPSDLSQPITVSLKSAARIRIRVADDLGRPVIGAKVRATSIGANLMYSSPYGMPSFAPPDGMVSSFSGRTDGHGEVILDDLPDGDEVQLIASHPNFVPLISNPWSQALTFDVGAESVQEIRMQQAGAVAGAVLADGRPVGGLRVAVVQDSPYLGIPNNYRADVDPGPGPYQAIDGYSGVALTDSKGRYRLTGLMAGTYEVGVTDIPDGYVCRTRHGVIVRAGADANGALSLEQGGVIEGQIRYADGTKIAPSVGGYLTGTESPIQLSLSPDGKFRDRLLPGSYTLVICQGDSFRGPDYFPNYLYTGNFNIASGQVIPLHIVLPSPPADSDSASLSLNPGEPPFYGPIRFADGQNIRLRLVCEYGTKPWNPDGSRASDEDRRELYIQDTARLDNPSHRAMFAAIDGIDRNTTCRVVVPGSTETLWKTIPIWGRGGDVASPDGAAFETPRSLRITDLRLGIPIGDYRTVVSEPMQGPILHGTSVPMTANIQVSIPPEYWNSDVRLVAFDAAGAPHLPYNAPHQPFTAGRLFEYQFGGEMKRLDLQTREYDWITFTGVHLYPNDLEGKR